MTLQALVFDFDGLILDTEWSAFSTAAEVWTEHGVELDLAVWQEIVGTADHVHWSEMLENDLGRPIDRDTVVPARQAQHHVEIEAMDLLPGVVDLIEAAVTAGLALAVASSSPHEWVDGHLERRGLLDRFAVVVCRDDVARTKPDPELYRTALERLGRRPPLTPSPWRTPTTAPCRRRPPASPSSPSPTGSPPARTSTPPAWSSTR